MASKSVEEKQSNPSFEDVLEELGATGRFQLTQIICCYTSMFLTAFIMLSFVFLGYEPPHVCNTVNETSLLSRYGLLNDSTAHIAYRSCDIKISTNESGTVKEIDTINCPNGRNFFDAKHTTFLSEWDLVCESSGIAELSQTVFNIGQTVGGFLSTVITDRFGRRPVFIGCSFMACLFEFCVLAAPNIFVIYGLKFVTGVFYQALVCCFFVYGMEFVPPRHREANGVVMCNIWLFCAMLIGGMAYWFQNDSWTYLQMSTGIAGSFVLIYPFILYESPRWLAANDRIEEALHVLKKASKVNGKDYQQVKETFNAYVAHAFPKYNNMAMLGDEVHVVPTDSESEKKPTVLTLIRSKSLRKITLIAWYLFLTNVLVYFGLYLTSSNVAGNRFLNYTLLNIVEIPSNFCILILMKKMSRRWVMEIFLALTAVSLLSSGLLTTFAGGSQTSDIASLLFFIVGKFAISCSFNVLYMVVPELYPTNLRSTASGLCSGLSRIGVMVGPFLRPLFKIVKWGPALIFTVMCIGALIATPLLPETKDSNLFDTVDDVENKVKKKRSS